MNRPRFTRLSTTLALGGVACAAALLSTAGTTSTAQAAVDQYANLPNEVTINAVVRDFRDKGAKNAQNVVIGSPDFEYNITNQRVGTVASALSSEGKPVFLDRWGKNITTQYTDKNGLKIMPAMYNASLGDRAGATAAPSTKDNSTASLNSASQFDKWYRDVPGTNMSTVVPLKLVRVANSNRYVFDSANDQPWKGLGGFFPINGAQFGNYSTTGKNFHFTTEVQTEFVFEKGAHQTFKFTGDDDVWVFVAGQMVIDLGGIHGVAEQTIDLDRVNGLENGKRYKLAIFHAERHTTESNFRMETTLKLEPVKLPATAALHD